MSENKKGYLRVRLSKGRDKKYSFLVHRLVAKAFIPNPNCLPQINHIDGNKKNNCVNNLEWCNNSYNQLQAYKLNLNDRSKYYAGRKRIKVAQIKNNHIINIFDTLTEAAKKTNSYRELIGKCVHNKRHSHNGYRWIRVFDDNMKVGDVIQND